jgi:glycosyltransferase involved in cell wall biosynthesis
LDFKEYNLNLGMIFGDLPQEWNCSQYNIVDPANAFNRSGVHKANIMHITDFVKNDENTQKIISEADFILIERNLFQDALTMMQFWKVRGKHIGVIFDDAYHIMHPKNVSHNFWTYGEIKYQDAEGKEQMGNMYPRPLDQLRWGIAMSKGLQTVSQALADDWAHVNDTYVINNNIVVDRYLNVEPLYKHDGTIFIGWTGSLSHVDSFESSGILRAFKKIVKTYDNVKILISGDKRIFDVIDIPLAKKVFQPFVPADKYPSLIKTLDICTIPLSGEYDKRRSWIKPLECLALKVPFVATNYPNYNQLKDHGIMVENKWQNWEAAIVDAIDNLPKHRQKAEEVGFPFAMTQSIDLHVDERIALYQKMIDKPYK